MIEPEGRAMVAADIVNLDDLSSKIDSYDPPIVIEWLKLILALEAPCDRPDPDKMSLALREHLFVHDPYLARARSMLSSRRTVELSRPGGQRPEGSA